jgi:hypothetical protein
MADEPTTTETKPQTDPPAPPANTLTQEQVDKIVEKRLAREREKYADYDELKTKAAEYQKLEDAKKSEAQKLEERIAAAEKRAADAEKAVGEAQIDALRARVAAKRNLSDAQAKRLQGTTVEELEADAAELFGEPNDEAEDEAPPSRSASRRPQPRLKGGLDPEEEPDESDPMKLAAAIPRF